MIDPILFGALVVVARFLVAWLITLLPFPFPIDETTLNTLATALVVAALALFGLDGAKAILYRAWPGLTHRGILKQR